MQLVQSDGLEPQVRQLLAESHPLQVAKPFSKVRDSPGWSQAVQLLLLTAEARYKSAAHEEQLVAEPTHAKQLELQGVQVVTSR